MGSWLINLSLIAYTQNVLIGVECTTSDHRGTGNGKVHTWQWESSHKCRRAVLLSAGLQTNRDHNSVVSNVTLFLGPHGTDAERWQAVQFPFLSPKRN